MFLVFLHLLSMFSLDDCWWDLFLSLEMLYYHKFMFIWCGKLRVCSCLEVYVKELSSAENMTHWVCWNSEFSGCNTEVFAFLWYLVDNRLMRILEFESPHFVEYKNRYEFLKFAVLLKALFQHRCGNLLQTSKFCSWCLSWIFSYYIRCVFGTSPTGIMLKSSSNN